jgi:hypothetical protein
MLNLTKPPSIQGIAWKPGLQAIKDSAMFSTFDDFKAHLQNSTRQNSAETRKKYASLIISRLFPEKSLDGINPITWRFYRDEIILEDLARATTLESEPVISKFLLEQVMILSPGSSIDNSVLKDFISSEYGVFLRDSYSRLRQALNHMGFTMQGKNVLQVQPIPLPNNAFIIMLHARLAPTPRIVRISDILDTSFWKLMGIRDETTVRFILRDANAKGLIAKYSIVDQLEQITTRYSFDEYIAKTLSL